MLKIRILKTLTVNCIIPSLNPDAFTVDIKQESIVLEYGKIYEVKEISMPDSDNECDVLFNDLRLVTLNRNDFESWSDVNQYAQGGPPGGGCCNK